MHRYDAPPWNRNAVGFVGEKSVTNGRRNPARPCAFPKGSWIACQLGLPCVTSFNPRVEICIKVAFRRHFFPRCKLHALQSESSADEAGFACQVQSVKRVNALCGPSHEKCTNITGALRSCSLCVNVLAYFISFYAYGTYNRERYI